jgi:hypothetical protein
MQEWLGNPAVQAGVAPFAAALVIALALRNSRALVLALAAALLVVVWLTMGLDLEPLTSVRKLVLAGFASVLFALVLDALLWRLPLARLALLALAAAGVAIWVALRLLMQREGIQALASGAAAALFLAGLVAGAQRNTEDEPLRSGSLALMLGLGTGALGLLGASAQLAQIAIAIGAAGGALLLALLLARRPWNPSALVVPAAVVTGLAGLLAVFTGVLPWYCLLPVLAAPWAVRLVPARPGRPGWLTAACTAGAAALPMSLAVVLAWFTAGAST